MPVYDYFDDWKASALACSACKWEGCGSAATLCFANWDLSELHCPKCGETLALINHPTDSDMLANWDKLSERSRQLHLGRQKFLADFERRKLKSPAQLPDIVAPSFTLLWDQATDNDHQETLILHDGNIIYSEPTLWEGYERFIEVAKILREKYGLAIRDLVPSDKSKDYLGGDVLSAFDRIDEAREKIFGVALKASAPAPRTAAPSPSVDLPNNLQTRPTPHSTTAPSKQHPAIQTFFEATSHCAMTLSANVDYILKNIAGAGLSPELRQKVESTCQDLNNTSFEMLSDLRDLARETNSEAAQPAKLLAACQDLHSSLHETLASTDQTITALHRAAETDSRYMLGSLLVTESAKNILDAANAFTEALAGVKQACSIAPEQAQPLTPGTGITQQDSDAQPPDDDDVEFFEDEDEPDLMGFYVEDREFLKDLQLAIRKLLRRPSITPVQAHHLAKLLHALTRFPRPTPGMALELTLGIKHDNGEQSYLDLYLDDNTFRVGNGAVLTAGDDDPGDSTSDTILEVEVGGYRELLHPTAFADWVEEFSHRAGDPKNLLEISDTEDGSQIDWTTKGDPRDWEHLDSDYF